MPGREHYLIKLPMIDPRTIFAAWLSFRNRHGSINNYPPYLIPVRHDSAWNLRNATRVLARYFQKEFFYDFIQWETYDNDPNTIAFLWTRAPETIEPVWGAACFRWRDRTDAPAGWSLDWVWFHPYERNKGHLKEAWPFFKTVFGDFDVSTPTSPAMKAFVANRKRAAEDQAATQAR